MELRQLKSFDVVARLLSFQRAAEVLNYAPSSVSTQIRLLEEELGVPLFDRLGKHIRLTAAGRMLVNYARKMLDIERETLTKVSGLEQPNGVISIRMPQSIATHVLPPVLSAFQKDYPGIGLDVSTCAYDVLIEELKSGLTDLAFLLADSIPFSDLTSEVLGFEQLVVVSSPAHPLAKMPLVHVADLSGHAILLPKHDCSYKMMFEWMLLEEKVGKVTFMALNSIEAIKKCVEAGIGAAMLPMMSVRQELAEKTLTLLPWPHERLETALLMIRHKGKWLSPALRALMETMRKINGSPV